MAPSYALCTNDDAYAVVYSREKEESMLGIVGTVPGVRGKIKDLSGIIIIH